MIPGAHLYTCLSNEYVTVSCIRDPVIYKVVLFVSSHKQYQISRAKTNSHQPTSLRLKLQMLSSLSGSLEVLSISWGGFFH